MRGQRRKGNKWPTQAGGVLLCMAPNPAFMPSLLQLQKTVSDSAFHL